MFETSVAVSQTIPADDQDLSRRSSWILLCFFVLIITAGLTGCNKDEATAENPANEAVPETAAISEEPAPARQAARPANATPPLKQLEERAGLALPAGAKVMAHGDGGVPDASVGFYEWAIVVPSIITWPEGHESSLLPLKEATEYVQSKMANTRIEEPLTAVSTQWKKNGFDFSATCIHAQKGDYLSVQQFRAP